MGRPFASHRPLSAFGEYVVELCTAKNIPASSLDTVFKSKKRMSYALRARETASERKASLLTYTELTKLSEVLTTNRDQTNRLIILGLLEHAPKELQSCVHQLIMVSTAAQDKKAAPLVYDFSGNARKYLRP